jgi:hypothetical protein
LFVGYNIEKVSGWHYDPGHQMAGALGGPHERGIKYEGDVFMLIGVGSGNDVDYRPRPVLATFCQRFHCIRELRGYPQAMLDPGRDAGMVGMFTQVCQTAASCDTGLMQEKKVGFLGEAGERLERARPR